MVKKAEPSAKSATAGVTSTPGAFGTNSPAKSSAVPNSPATTSASGVLAEALKNIVIKAPAPKVEPKVEPKTEPTAEPKKVQAQPVTPSTPSIVASTKPVAVIQTSTVNVIVNPAVPNVPVTPSRPVVSTPSAPVITVEHKPIPLASLAPKPQQPSRNDPKERSEKNVNDLRNALAGILKKGPPVAAPAAVPPVKNEAVSTAPAMEVPKPKSPSINLIDSVLPDPSVVVVPKPKKPSINIVDSVPVPPSPSTEPAREVPEDVLKQVLKVD